MVSNSSFIGFLLTPSINKIIIFPPSNGGNGKRFVTPNDKDISESKYINSTIPLVFDTASDIPIGPVNWSTLTFPVNSNFKFSIIEVEKWELVSILIIQLLHHL